MHPMAKTLKQIKVGESNKKQERDVPNEQIKWAVNISSIFIRVSSLGLDGIWLLLLELLLFSFIIIIINIFDFSLESVHSPEKDLKREVN